ncbi:hypothetical protein TWF730_002896 [Orbilia blumenaviensis]|uniref:Uncharacterized protein n=1 Tax=Orbilia blumenaviensis TaxID=1796055 RepID=A0AAV9UA33_9PEZI
MSIIDSNLIDLQPQATQQTQVGQCPLAHYERANKRCISLRVLPYTRPYVLPLSKISAIDNFADTISTLPEARPYGGTAIKKKLLFGEWRIIDEAGSVIRLQDWEELAIAGVQIILDTDGSSRRQAERVDAVAAVAYTPVPENQKTLSTEPGLGVPGSVSTGAPKFESAAVKKEEPQQYLLEVEEDGGKEIEEEYENPQAEPLENEAVEEPIEPQGDPEWNSWSTANPEPIDGWGATGPVTLKDGGWGNDNSTPPRDPDWGSSSTFHNRDNGSISSRLSRPGTEKGYHSPHKPYPLGKKPNNKGWQIPRSTSPNGYSKGKFPKKIHLTFYAPFKLPQGSPPTPQPLYNRFSIPPETPMHQVALKVLGRHPFSSMPTPSSPDFVPENHVFVFLEVREELVNGKKTLGRGRVMKVLGKTTMAEMGLSTDGGLENMGRYYFIVRDFFAESMDI